MTSVPAPLCVKCKHFEGYETDELICTAFPRGIPEEIILGSVEHIKPIKGDNGFIFEPISDQEVQERVQKYRKE